MPALAQRDTADLLPKVDSSDSFPLKLEETQGQLFVDLRKPFAQFPKLGWSLRERGIDWRCSQMIVLSPWIMCTATIMCPDIYELISKSLSAAIGEISRCWSIPV